MKSTSAVLLVLMLPLWGPLLPAVPAAHAQEKGARGEGAPDLWRHVDSTLATRNLWQQLFSSDHFKIHLPSAPVRSPEALDAHVRHLAEAWTGEASGTGPQMQRLGAYASMMAAKQLAQLEGGALPRWARCHAWRTYAAPAFRADLRFFNDGVPTPQKAEVLFMPDVDWGLNPAFRCELSKEVWTPLYAAAARVPGRVEQYVEQGAYAGEQRREQLRRAARRVEQKMALLDVVSDVYEDRLGRAFSGLTAIFSEGRMPIALLVPVAHRLAGAFASEANAPMALAALDLLSRYTTSEDLSRATLKGWYEEADSEGGAGRFEKMNADALPSLVAGEQKAKLTGTYQNLATGEPFDLAQLEGKTVLLDFWTTWCGPCIEEIPDLNAFVQAHDEGDIVLVSIASDAVAGGQPAGQVKAFAEKHGITYVVLYDRPKESLTEQFGVRSYPSKFLIRADGALLRHPTDKSRRTVTLAEAEAYLEAQS